MEDCQTSQHFEAADSAPSPRRVARSRRRTGSAAKLPAPTAVAKTSPASADTPGCNSQARPVHRPRPEERRCKATRLEGRFRGPNVLRDACFAGSSGRGQWLDRPTSADTPGCDWRRKAMKRLDSGLRMAQAGQSLEATPVEGRFHRSNVRHRERSVAIQKPPRQASGPPRRNPPFVGGGVRVWIATSLRSSRRRRHLGSHGSALGRS